LQFAGVNAENEVSLFTYLSLFHKDTMLINSQEAFKGLNTKLALIIFLCLLMAMNLPGQSLTDEVRILRSGQVSKSVIKSGEQHLYKVALEQGEYFQLDVMQHNIDIEIVLNDSKDSLLLERNRPTGSFGSETLSFIARSKGEYRVKLIALTDADLTGEYDLKCSIKRVPGALDYKRIKAETLLEAGRKMLQVEKPEIRKKSCLNFEAAAILWRGINDSYAEAVASTTLGNCRASLNDLDGAVKPLERSLMLYGKLNDQANVAMHNWGLGKLNLDLGRYKKALEYYTATLPYWKQIKDTWREADTIGAIGRIHFLEERYLESIESNFQLLPIWRSIPDKVQEAKAIHNIGFAYSMLNDEKKALEYLFQSLEIVQKTDDYEGLANTLNSIAGVYISIGDTDNALQYFNKALDVWRVRLNKPGLAQTLHEIGTSLSYRSKDNEAIKYFDEAIEIWRAIPDKKGEANSLNGRGSSYAHIGSEEKALEDFKAAFSISQEDDMAQQRLASVHNLSRSYLALSDYKAALDFAEQTRSLSRKLNDTRIEIKALYVTGAIHISFNDIEGALTYYKKALDLFKKVDKDQTDRNQEAEIWVSVGLALSTKRGTEAIEYYNRALTVFRNNKNRLDEGTTMSSIAKIYAANGDREKALKLFNEALLLKRENGFKGEESSDLLNMGLIKADMGQKQEAIEFYNRALLSSTVTSDKYVRMGILTDLMAELRETGDPDLAIFYGKQCINLIQEIRRNLQGLSNDPQRPFLKNLDNMYANLSTQLIDQGRFEEAHEVLNAYKDQQYFDSDSQKTKQPQLLTFTPLETHWNSQYADLAGKSRKVESEYERAEKDYRFQRVTQNGTANLQEAQKRLDDANNDFLNILKNAREDFKNRTTAAIRAEDTRRMQTALREIGGKTVVIYTIQGGYGYRALVITANEIIPISSSASSADLNNKALQLWALLQSNEYDPRTLSKEVYDLIFKPIKDKLIKENKLEKVLPEDATILWSLDDNLRGIPMAALYDGEKYLVEHYNNVVFTRAETDKWLINKPKNWTGIGLGSSQSVTLNKPPYYFSPIANSVKELATVFNEKNSAFGAFEGKIFSDRRFTQQNMISALQSSEPHPLVHVASHFYFSPGSADDSYLVLGDGDIFTLSEINKYPKLFAGVDLLTLSACETGAQKPDSNGREIDGFAESAQRQGAAAVIATLWNVREDSSYLLMRNFYQNIRMNKNIAKGEALRRAQLDLLSGAVKPMSAYVSPKRLPQKRGNSTSIKILPEGTDYPDSAENGVVWVEAKYARPNDPKGVKTYKHPYFWSPFILFGNWR
jgi:CHAT domain-containing protein/tetratricopeptide (TPR) repeat protein